MADLRQFRVFVESNRNEACKSWMIVVGMVRFLEDESVEVDPSLYAPHTFITLHLICSQNIIRLLHTEKDGLFLIGVQSMSRC